MDIIEAQLTILPIPTTTRALPTLLLLRLTVTCQLATTQALPHTTSSTPLLNTTTCSARQPDMLQTLLNMLTSAAPTPTLIPTVLHTIRSLAHRDHI